VATEINRLAPEDARILRLETSAIAGHTCKVAIVAPRADGRVEFDQLRASVEARLGRVPRCRQRVEFTPMGLGAPAWVDDEGFDIGNHVVRAAAGGAKRPIGDDRFRRHAGELMGTRLDHRRPLWRLDVFHLTDQRTGLVMRIHHAMADGISALRIGEDILWDPDPDAAEAHTEPWEPRPSPSRLRLAADGIAERTADAGRAMADALGNLAHPRRVLESLRETAREPAALLRELTPLGNDSSLDRHIGPDRELAFADAKLDDLKRVEHAVGDRIGRHVTVNDVVLAVVAGGLRRWLEERGESGEELRAQIPVSMHGREEGAVQLSNADSFINVDLPISEPDPVRRLERINAESVDRKQHHDADSLYRFFHGLSHVSPLYREAMRLAAGPREFSLSISNVPGPRGAVYVLGGEVSDLHSIAEPADRHALRVSAVSLDGVMHIALCTDPDALTGLDDLARAIEASVEELLERV
jgi:diacylglycerol O-acyltransferase / wax synthase